jgi:hypothetical protein
MKKAEPDGPAFHTSRIALRLIVFPPIVVAAVVTVAVAAAVILAATAVVELLSWVDCLPYLCRS